MTGSIHCYCDKTFPDWFPNSSKRLNFRIWPWWWWRPRSLVNFTTRSTADSHLKCMSRIVKRSFAWHEDGRNLHANFTQMDIGRWRFRTSLWHILNYFSVYAKMSRLKSLTWWPNPWSNLNNKLQCKIAKLFHSIWKCAVSILVNGP